MPARRSRKSYAASAKKGAATRRRNAAFAKRSAAAKKGWTTRRRNEARDYSKQYAKRPGGKNLRGKKPVSYKVRKFGFEFAGDRFDFRGLTKTQRDAQFRNVLSAAPGHYARMLVFTTDESTLRGLYPGEMLDTYLRRHRKGRPFWFWTSEKYIDSSLAMYETVTEQFANQTAVGDVKIALVEII